MAESSTDSDSSIAGWTLVSQKGEYTASDSGSASSSSEFVQLDSSGALYQRRRNDRHNGTGSGDEDAAAAAPVEDTTADRPSEVCPQETPLIRGQDTDSNLSSSPTENESENQQEDLAFELPLPLPLPLPGSGPVCAAPVETPWLEEVTVPAASGLEVCEGGATAATTGSAVVDQNQQIEILHAALLRQESDSDSDFVQLDALQADPGHVTAAEGEGRPLEGSPPTAPSPSSSISSQFRFVNPALVPRPQPPMRPEGGENEEEDEEESLVGDFDDRCESDISGVATDDTDDSDLSGLLYSIGDVPLTAGRRLYRHRPNSHLNATLSVVSLVALFFAVGIAVGHYIGVSRDGWLRKMQVEKMKGAQDNHLMCLKHANILKGQIRKLTATYEGDSPCSSMLDGGSVLRKTCGDILKMNNGDWAGMALNRGKDTQPESPIHTPIATVLEIPAPPVHTKANQLAEMELKKHVATLRADLNQVEQENSDLRGEVMRLRYTAHPANAHVDPQVAHHNLKVKVNQLTSENDDLKSAVGKMRYMAHPTNKQQLSDGSTFVDVDSSNASDSVDMEKTMAILEQRLENVTMELGAEKKMNQYLQGVVAKVQKEAPADPPPAPPASVQSCVQHQLPDITNIVGKYLEDNTHKYIAKFNDATIETTNQIVTTWKEVVHLLEAKNAKLTAEVERLLQVYLENDPVKKATEVKDVTGLDENNNVTVDVENKSDKDVVNVTSKPLTAHFHDYVNKTKLTVSKLSSTLQKTWQKVKNLSNEFIINPERTVKEVSEKIREKVSVIKEKVGVIKEKVVAKWATIKRKVKSRGWGHAGKNKYPKHMHMQQHSGHPHVHPQYVKMKQEKGPDPQQHHGGQSQSHDAYHQSDTQQFEDTPKQFEDKPHHKQRQSSHEQYNDFWQKVEFDPDDFFQEGFFEGNQREWRKQQKRLKHLHGQMHRLNEDILYSMDDDDIEDIYEEFDDLEDDLEDEDQPQTLQTWLACQVRWWKSRLHRKHRSEDLIRGCGQQMMQWQLRALCKDRCVGKKCWKKGRGNLREHPMCQQALQPQDNYCRPLGRASAPANGLKDMDSQRFHSKPSHQNTHDHVKDSMVCDYVKDGKSQPHGQPTREANLQKPAESPIASDTAIILPADLNVTPPLQRWAQLPDEEELFTMEPAKGDSSEWLLNDTFWFPEDPVEIGEGDMADAGDLGDVDSVADTEPLWVFERAAVREYHHHNPDWVFERAKDRQLLRNKPWYLARSDQRQQWRMERADQQYHRQQQEQQKRQQQQSQHHP